MNRKWPGRALAVVIAAALAVGCMVLFNSQHRRTTENVSTDFQPLRAADRFPPITDFPIQAVSKVRDSVNPSELVIGVTLGKESRAYPLNTLTGPAREILNDTLDGQPIAATW